VNTAWHHFRNKECRAHSSHHCGWIQKRKIILFNETFPSCNTFALIFQQFGNLYIKTFFHPDRWPTFSASIYPNQSTCITHIYGLVRTKNTKIPSSISPISDPFIITGMWYGMQLQESNQSFKITSGNKEYIKWTLLLLNWATFLFPFWCIIPFRKMR
jgi:hypothetical protein